MPDRCSVIACDPAPSGFGLAIPCSLKPIADSQMSLIITGAAILDGVAEEPIEGHSIWIDGGRIKAVCRCDELGAPPGAEFIDARGKYAIPGLMNANVHLLNDVRLEN